MKLTAPTSLAAARASVGSRPKLCVAKAAEVIAMTREKRNRLLMNPAVMKSGHLSAADAIEAVETELAGRHPGRVVFPTKKPDQTMLRKATGPKQVMDFWLAQIAAELHCTLVTNDSSLADAWPELVTRVG